MQSRGRNNLIAYCLPVSGKHDVRIDHLFPQTPSVITASDACKTDNVTMAIADSHGNSVTVNCHNIGEFSIAMDGQLTNQDHIYQEILMNNLVLLNKSSEELVAYLLAEGATDGKPISALIKQFLVKYPGGYSLLVMNKDCIYAARDPFGIKPLVIGCIENDQDVAEFDLEHDKPTIKGRIPNIIASTREILENMAAKYLRQVLPGEIVELSTTGLKSVGICYRPSGDSSSFCSLEYVLMESPFSFLQDQRVYDVRHRLGQALARDSAVTSDCVVTLPNISLAFILGYVQAFSIPIIEAFYYLTTAKYHRQLKLYNENISGKSVTIVVDSVLNCDLSCALSLLKQCDVKEVHLRICSPDTVGSCPFGIEVSADSSNCQLITTTKFLKIESFSETIHRKIPEKEVNNIGHCFNCFGKSHTLSNF